MGPLTVLVASHKPYWMPADRSYLPVQVGAQGKKTIVGFQRDDDGENISVLNPNFCELTAHYWAWKNLEADAVGLVHYRRYFAVSYVGEKRSRIASGDRLAEQLKETPVILPRKRNYFIETNWSQYVHAHHEEDLIVTRQVVMDRWPDYVAAFEASMKRTSGHRFNMFVMRRDAFDKYSEWLFDVLFAVRDRLDISGYSLNDSRVFGFISERLIDVWIQTNSIAYAEMPVVNLEPQYWLKKGAIFLGRKFRCNSSWYF